MSSLLPVSPHRPLGSGAARGRTRVLIVNAYVDSLWRYGGRPESVPQSMAPVYLAGAFAPDRCDVRLYNEHASGPLRDEALLAWPDMLVLTGLTSAFDRMLHVAAYVRSRNPRVVVVAGGPGVRALPRYARSFFDHACTGDVEQMRDVVTEAFGADHAAELMTPRFDLAYWTRGRFRYVESSRNCNFRCAFCSLTGEGNRYQRYALDDIRRQIRAAGRGTGRGATLVFLDNNFYGNDQQFFHARLALLREMRARGEVDSWSALVTSDFFARDENLALAYEAGCRSLFSGVESFDADTLRGFNKLQNVRLPQVAMIRRCLEAGIAFFYGIVLDPANRPLADLRREIEFILATPEIPLPTYVCLAVPLLGTPYFRDCLARGLLLPNTRLRDLDGLTLALRPLDPLPEVEAFVRDLPTLRGYRVRAARHSLAFVGRYRRHQSTAQLVGSLVPWAMLCKPSYLASAWRSAPRRKTFVTTTEALDPLYAPAFRVANRYADHFRPTMLTDAAGALNAALADDLLAPPRRSAASALPATARATDAR